MPVALPAAVGHGEARPALLLGGDKTSGRLRGQYFPPRADPHLCLSEVDHVEAAGPPVAPPVAPVGRPVRPGRGAHPAAPLRRGRAGRPTPASPPQALPRPTGL